MLSKSLRKLAWIGFAAALGLSSAAAPAKASLTLYLAERDAGSLTTNTATVSDGGTGSVTYATPMGNFSTNFSLGLAGPPQPTQATAELYLHNSSLASVKGGTLQLVLVDSGITAGVGFYTDAVLLASIGGTLQDGKVTAQTYFSPSNGAPGNPLTIGGVTIPADATEGYSPNPYVADASGSFAIFSTGGFDRTGITLPTSGSYSLFYVITVQLNANGSLSGFDADTQVVPEPATIAMAGACVPLLAAFALRRFKKSRA